jgi:hypothetical protein
MIRRTLLPCAIACLAVCFAAGAGRAQTGSTLTPDRLSYLVNKDVGTDRFTIGLNLSSTDTSKILNATGNVFRSDGGPPTCAHADAATPLAALVRELDEVPARLSA